MRYSKKGFMIELITFTIIGIVVVLFFAGIIYGFGILNNVLSDTSLDTAAANITGISALTIGKLNTGFLNLRLVAIGMLISYMIATFIVAYFSSKHPIWFFVYFLVTVILVIFSIYISNAYNTMKTNTVLGATLTSFSVADIIISYLPIWVAVIGLFGSVFSIIGMVAVRRLAE